MVKIRLTRTGKRHEPHYRIVATDSRVQRDGKYLEKIGYYNPRTKPPTLDYDKEILQKWIDRGAQMTDTVHDIFVREGIVKQSKKRTARVSMMVERSKKLTTEEIDPDAPADKTEMPKPETKSAEKAKSEDKPKEKPKPKPKPKKEKVELKKAVKEKTPSPPKDKKEKPEKAPAEKKSAKKSS